MENANRKMDVSPNGGNDNLKLKMKEFDLTDLSFIKKIVGAEQERLKKLSEIGELTSFFFQLPEYETSLLVWKGMELSAVRANLEKIIELLEKIPDEAWTNDSIEEALMSYIRAKEYKTGEYLWPMRASLSGQKASPGPFDIAEVLGREETVKRMQVAIDKITA